MNSRRLIASLKAQDKAPFRLSLHTAQSSKADTQIPQVAKSFTLL